MQTSRLRAFGLAAVLSLAGMNAAAQAPPPPPMPGPYDLNLDWINNKRGLTFCVAPGTPVVIADGARDAATTLNAAGFGWFLMDAGVCPANWSLRALPFLQPDIRIRIAPLGPLNLAANGFPNQPHEPDSSPTPGSGSYGGGNTGKPNPNDQPPAGANRVFVNPPLAYFQSGPFVGGGRQFAYGEVVFNYQVINGVADPRWDTTVGSRAFDPIEVGMHELGHAIRLDHDNLQFDDDVSVIPSGAASPLLLANDIAVQKGADGVLQTPLLPGDVLIGGDIAVGGNLWADSGKKMNVMRSGIERGQHGVNPFNGVPANAEWAYTTREQATANAARMQIPPGQNANLHIFAGAGRAMDWKAGVWFCNAAWVALFGWIPPVVQNDFTQDFIVWGAAPAPKLYAEGDVYQMAMPAAKTAVKLWADLGAAPANTTQSLRVWVPYTAATPKLGIVADWAANTITYFDINVNPAVQLCQIPLTAGHPVDCNWLSAGVVNVRLSNVPPPPPPPPPPGGMGQ